MSFKKLKVPRGIKKLLCQIHAQVEAVWPDFAYSTRTWAGTVKQAVTVSEAFYRDKHVRERLAKAVDEDVHFSALAADLIVSGEETCMITFENGEARFTGNVDTGTASGCIFTMAKAVVPHLTAVGIEKHLAHKASRTQAALIIDHLITHVEKRWPNAVSVKLDDVTWLFCTNEAALKKTQAARTKTNGPSPGMDPFALTATLLDISAGLKVSSCGDPKSYSYKIAEEFHACPTSFKSVRITTAEASEHFMKACDKLWPNNVRMPVPFPAVTSQVAARYFIFQDETAQRRWEARADKNCVSLTMLEVLAYHAGHVLVNAATCAVAANRPIVDELLRAGGVEVKT